jgi:phosphoadenosine phosphosulfate reductase
MCFAGDGGAFRPLDIVRFEEQICYTIQGAQGGRQTTRKPQQTRRMMNVSVTGGFSLIEGGLAPLNAKASALNAHLDAATPETVIASALQAVASGRLAVVSSFGTEAAVLLAAVAAVDHSIPVLMIDTGYLFPETLAYRDMLQERLGLTDLRTLTPEKTEVETDDREGDLFIRDPDACCALRKVRPLAGALHGFDAWANGRKRYQADSRSAIPIVEVDGPRLKFNPLARLSRAEVVEKFRALGLPYHPLEKHGFASIGCMPCTTRVAAGEDPRAGRWRGRGKVECGLHTGPLAAARR